MVTQNIKIIMDDSKLPDIRMVSGDVGRDIFPAVYPSEDADEALDLTVYQLRVIFIKPDNTFVIQDYLDGMIEIPEQAGAVTGRGFYQIRLSKDGEEIYSGQGDFYIDDQILNEGLVESIAEVNGMQFPDDFLTSADLADYVTQEQLSDYYTKSEIDAELNNIRNYSTTEKSVGTWIDNSVIYETTVRIEFNTAWGGTRTNVPHNIANIDKILGVNAWFEMKDGSAITSQIRFNNDNLSVNNATCWSDVSLQINTISRNNITIQAGHTYANSAYAPAYIVAVIQYTKTS